MLDLAPIKARVAATTPGDWRESSYYLGDVVIRSSHGSENSLLGIRCGTVPVVKSPADAAFIARSRADVEALISEVEQLRAEIDRYENISPRCEDSSRPSQEELSRKLDQFLADYKASLKGPHDL